MIFNDLTKKLEVIEITTSRNEKTRILAKLFKDASAKEACLLSYLFLGVIRPTYEGTQFNVAEKTMFEVVCKLCKISLQDLKFWKLTRFDHLVNSNYSTTG